MLSQSQVTNPHTVYDFSVSAFITRSCARGTMGSFRGYAAAYVVQVIMKSDTNLYFLAKFAAFIHTSNRNISKSLLLLFAEFFCPSWLQIHKLSKLYVAYVLWDEPAVKLHEIPAVVKYGESGEADKRQLVPPYEIKYSTDCRHRHPSLEI